MQFVQHGLVPRPAAPVGMPPLVGARIDDDAGAMHVAILARARPDRAPRCRPPERSGSACRRRSPLPPRTSRRSAARHRQRRAALNRDRDRALRRCPQAKAGPSASTRFAPNGRRQCAPSWPRFSHEPRVDEHGAVRDDDDHCHRRCRAPRLRALRYRSERAGKIGRRQTKRAIFGGRIEQQGQQRDRAVVVARGRAAGRACGVPDRSRLLGDLLPACVEPGDVGNAGRRLVLTVQETVARAAPDAPWRSAISRATKARSIATLGGMRQAPVQPATSRCPGNRRCCCLAGCARTRRRRAASACRGENSTVASMAR